ncbi:unnamed protein product [Bemisia tabaci]|uniref:Ionotropic glutamate receptor C-terminal domain-containing protein n=1 Tax=Bemisia tabaci TaxID=7038 RepID=A0A9P0AIM8_BEMTA|nr:unnamed protein product [Bemisia tabaci]
MHRSPVIASINAHFWNWKDKALYLPYDRAGEHMVSSAIKVCQTITKLSGKALFYVISTRPDADVPVQNLIQNLHEGMIETVVITHHSRLQHSIHGSATKNIIIFLNDLDEILSFILASSSKFDGIVDLKPRKFEKLNHYCFQNDLFEFDLTAVNKTCDFSLHINQTELDGTVFLSDPVAELTKGLFANRVWNSRNYITFFLPTIKEEERNTVVSDSLRFKFLFQFFWRFFRGLRTVVCFDHTCFKYDPFIDLISQIDIISENNFAFVPDVRGKILNVVYVSKEDVFKTGAELTPVSLTVMGQAAMDIEKKLQCVIVIYGRYKELYPNHESIDYFKNAQANNFDLLIFDGSLSPSEDFSMFDFSAAIQSLSYCFATPRSIFIPQSFLPFMCFSPQTWVVIILTILSLYVAFYAFHRSQLILFNGLYSEIERLAFANTPASFYLYSFLVVGSPPRLLLGRVFTGKLLFSIVSLFVLVIITVYQSQLTTLLAKQVRYPEIDTVEDLKNSDLVIQTPDLEASLQLLQDYPFYDDMKTKLTEGPYHYRRILFEYAGEYLGNSMNILELTGQNISHANLDLFSRKLNDLASNFRSILESNAVELVFSNLHHKYRGNIKIEDPFFPDTFAEFHVVKECMLTYPMTLQVQKNSYLSDFFIEEIESYVEKGLVPKLMANTCFYPDPWKECARFMKDVTEDGDGPAFAFTIENVQPAFVILIIGWISSGVVFAVELMVDIFNEIGNPRILEGFFCILHDMSVYNHCTCSGEIRKQNDCNFG